MKTIINTKLIENFMKEKNLSKTQFCKLCKITPRTPEKIFNDEYDYDLRALFKMAKLMDLKIYQLFN